jgi:hypothetical protein
MGLDIFKIHLYNHRFVHRKVINRKKFDEIRLMYRITAF